MPEVVVVESTTISIVESTSEAATMTTIMESASHAPVEAAAFEAATVKTSTTEALSRAFPWKSALLSATPGGNVQMKCPLDAY